MPGCNTITWHASQSALALALVLVPRVPAGHSVHGSAVPGASVYVPTRQESQVARLPAEAKPGWHGVSMPFTQNEPAPHSTHAVRSSLAKNPAGHTLQKVLPGPSEAVP